MSAVQVDVDEVRTAASGVVEAAQMIDSCALNDDLAVLSEALPGSQSATAAQGLADLWQDVTARWARGAQVHSESLQAGARDYDDVDRTSARAHDHLAQRLAGKVPQ